MPSQEEVESGYKKLNEETISFIQEMVESHQYLPKYGMFHDIFTFEKEHTIQMFHDFLDFNVDICSLIHQSSVYSWNDGAKDIQKKCRKP